MPIASVNATQLGEHLGLTRQRIGVLANTEYVIERLPNGGFLIDGEAVIVRDDGTPDFRALRSKRRGHEAVLFAFDLIELDGDDCAACR